MSRRIARTLARLRSAGRPAPSPPTPTSSSPWCRSSSNPAATTQSSCGKWRAPGPRVARDDLPALPEPRRADRDRHRAVDVDQQLRGAGAARRRASRVYDGLMRGLRYVFEPWERNPRMLEAYHRARTGPGRPAARPPGHAGHHAERQRAARRRRPGVRRRHHAHPQEHGVRGHRPVRGGRRSTSPRSCRRSSARCTASPPTTRRPRSRPASAQDAAAPDLNSAATSSAAADAEGRGDRRRVRRDRGGREVAARRDPHVHDLRVVARDRRHVVGQHLPGRRGRRRLAPLLLLVQAARLDAHARPATRAAEVSRGDGRRVRPARRTCSSA